LPAFGREKIPKGGEVFPPFLKGRCEKIELMDQTERMGELEKP
jgi:hypothetical protein